MHHPQDEALPPKEQKLELQQKPDSQTTEQQPMDSAVCMHSTACSVHVSETLCRCWTCLCFGSSLLPFVGDQGGRCNAGPNIQWRHKELNLCCPPSGNPARWWSVKHQYVTHKPACLCPAARDRICRARGDSGSDETIHLTFSSVDACGLHM